MSAIKKTFIIAFALLQTSTVFACDDHANNKDVVLGFYNIAFNDHKPTAAANKYLAPDYKQHNPNVGNGPQAFYTYFEKYFKQYPQSHSTIQHVIADKDLVALHVHSQHDAKDDGRAIVDIFRVKNGKIVEHWDVIEAVQTKTANGNSMF